MNIKFSHYNILVNDLEEAVTYYRRALDWKPSDKLYWKLDSLDIEYRMMFKDATRFGLVHPLAGYLKDWLDTRGPGTVYRCAYTTPDMKLCFDELVAAGVQPEDIEGRPASRDNLVAPPTGTPTMFMPKVYGHFSVEILEEAHFEGRMEKLRDAAMRA